MWANYTGGALNRTYIDMGDFNLSYIIDVDWLKMDILYKKSSLENKYVQPMDKYSIKFQNDFLKVKFGDSYPNIDDYGWNGSRIRGVNFLIDKGPLYLNIVNGKTKRAVQGNPSNNAMVISNIDSTLNGWIINVSRDNYTFQQDVIASKLKLKFRENAYWDLNYIKVQDNITTVSDVIPNAHIELPDSLVSRINPNINISFRFQRIVFFETSNGNYITKFFFFCFVCCINQIFRLSA